MKKQNKKEMDSPKGRINCPRCAGSFNPRFHPVAKLASLLAGAAGGGYVGGNVGIAGGPVGAISGVVPGAIIGGAFALLSSSKFTRCPSCNKIFKL